MTCFCGKPSAPGKKWCNAQCYRQNKGAKFRIENPRVCECGCGKTPPSRFLKYFNKECLHRQHAKMKPVVRKKFCAECGSFLKDNLRDFCSQRCSRAAVGKPKMASNPYLQAGAITRMARNYIFKDAAEGNMEAIHALNVVHVTGFTVNGRSYEIPKMLNKR